MNNVIRTQKGGFIPIHLLITHIVLILKGFQSMCFYVCCVFLELLPPLGDTPIHSALHYNILRCSVFFIGIYILYFLGITGCTDMVVCPHTDCRNYRAKC